MYFSYLDANFDLEDFYNMTLYQLDDEIKNVGMSTQERRRFHRYFRSHRDQRGLTGQIKEKYGITGTFTFCFIFFASKFIHHFFVLGITNLRNKFYCKFY